MTYAIRNKLDVYRRRSVPRYTSYPTAAQFERLDSSIYTEALAALDPDVPISLYLHVPFCRQLCWYCGCNMKLAAKQAPIAQYAETLRKEIGLVARHLPARMRVSHLHWGGGTPTALTPDDLAKLMESVHEAFDILPDAELAIESDPRALSDEMIAMIGLLGFTRASFGVQEFDPGVQTAINRIQPPDMVARAVHELRQAGVAGINFDLIYGLPHQTTKMLLNTIRICEEIGPDRIALFGYAHVPWVAKRQRLIDAAALPGPEARRDQAEKAARAIEAIGFQPIGLDHFAKPTDELAHAARHGVLRRNFQGYTTDQATTMLGLGASSIGRVPRAYVQNVAETGAWARSVEAGELPIGRGVILSKEDLVRADVIEALMCQGAVDLAEVAASHGVSPHLLGDATAELYKLQEDGLITFQNGRVVATEVGMPLIRVVASVFDVYLRRSSARHAVAV